MDSNIQDVNNQGEVGHQINVNNLKGNIELSKISRLGQRFKKLKEEVENNVLYNKFIDDFKRYNTELDGRSMPDKLADAGFNQNEINKATYRKHQYSKKLEKNKLYETAQLIDLELFAFISLNFETYVEPSIDEGKPKSEIKKCVKEYIIDPIYKLINEEGKDDTFLNYNVEDIYGMVFFLTGKCHLNWVNYDNI